MTSLIKAVSGLFSLFAAIVLVSVICGIVLFISMFASVIGGVLLVVGAVTLVAYGIYELFQGH